MPLAFRSAGAFADANATSTGAVGLPAGLANGDTMVMVVQARGTGGTIDTPAGWDQPAGLPIVRSASFRTTVFTKYVPTAGAESAPTVTQTVSGGIRARITAWSGGDDTTVLDVAVVGDHEAAASTVTAPSISPVSSGAMALWVFSTNDDNTLTSPTQGTAAFSSDGTAGADGSIALVYELQTSPGATGTCSMTESVNGPDPYIVITLALRPAAIPAVSPATDLFDDIDLDVDVAFGAGPFTPNPTWTRVTDYLSAAHAISIVRGRDDEDSIGTPGTMTLTLNNSIDQSPGRRFDPDYAAGPYFGQLNLRTPIRVWCRRNGTDHALYTGLVQSWRQVQVAGSRDSVTQVSAVDCSVLLANMPLPSTALHLAYLTDHPEVYLPMDEEEIGATIVDVSGSGWLGRYPNTVTIVDSIVRGQVGKKAKAGSLVGDTGFDGTIATMTASTTPENIRTLEAWVKVTAYDTRTVDVTGIVQNFAIYAYGRSNGLRLVAVTVDSGTERYHYWESDVFTFDGTMVAGWTEGFTLHTTYHVAAVLGDDDNLSLYINGELAGTAGTSGNTFEGGSLDPGLFIQIPNDEAAGTVAHVAAYQAALTADQILAHYTAGVVGSDLQTAAERLEVFADYAGFTAAGLFDSSAMGTHTFLGPSDLTGSVLDEMRKIIEADQGRLFVDGMGILTAQSRMTDIEPAFTEHVTSQGLYGDSAPSEIRYEDFNREPATEALLVNIVTVNGLEIRDDESVALYGPSAEDFTLPIGSPTSRRSFAQRRLFRYATPQPRTDRLVVNLRGHLSGELDTAQNTTLALDLGYRLTATIRPANGLGDDVTEAVRVEGIRDDITRHTWTRDLYLVPAGDAYNEGPYWTIGHATYGRIGTPAGNKIPG